MRLEACIPMEDAAANPPPRFSQFLADLSAELGQGAEPAVGLEALLLTALGSLGASCGFGWLAEDGASRGRWTARGISAAAATEWENILPRLIREISPESSPDGSTAIPLVGIVREAQAFPRMAGAEEIRLLLYWAGGGKNRGFLGLGPKLRGGDYTEGEKEILLGLVYLFLQRTAALPGGLPAASPRSGPDEARRELEALRKYQEKLQADFDRQIFYLKTLYDISSELADHGEARELLEAFLLMILGTFGFEEGFIQLYDRPEKRTLSVHRGGESREWSPLPTPDLLGLLPPGEAPGAAPVVRILSLFDFRRPGLLPPSLLKGPRFAFSLPEESTGRSRICSKPCSTVCWPPWPKSRPRKISCA
jgi:hypothetical protein